MFFWMHWFNLSFCKEETTGISPNLALFLRSTVSSRFVTAFSSAALERAQGSFIFKAELCFNSNAVGSGSQIQLCDRVMWHDIRVKYYPNKTQ